MYILQVIYFLLPAYFANMAPVICKKINFLNIPMDFGLNFRGKPLFGKHKTYRGLFFGILFGIIIAFIQYKLTAITFFKGISVVDYGSWLVIGTLLGAGAIIGDLVKSFFKRRAGIEPGKPWVPFDQTDFVLGALLLTWIIYPLDLKFILTALAVSFVLHIIVNHLAFFLKIRNEKW